MIKNIIHIILIIALLNVVLFVPQYINANTFLIQQNSLNEPDGELNSILGDIVSYCFDINLANTLNQNEDFVEKDLITKRLGSSSIFIFFSCYIIVIFYIIKSQFDNFFKNVNTSFKLNKQLSYLVLYYLY